MRAGNDAAHVNDHGVERELPWDDGTHLRSYTVQSFQDRVAAVPELVIDAWHSETTLNAEGVSQFDLAQRTVPPTAGRAIALLRRT